MKTSFTRGRPTALTSTQFRRVMRQRTLTLVVTAFIIESSRLLEPDPNAETVNILRGVHQQLQNPHQNTSITPSGIDSNSDVFEPPRYAVGISACWYLSLLASLFAVRGCLGVLRRVREFQYNSQIGKKEALYIRYHKLQGIEYWAVPEIIDGAHRALIISLYLFLAGLVVRLYSSNSLVPAVVCCITLTAVGLCELFAHVQRPHRARDWVEDDFAQRLGLYRRNFWHDTNAQTAVEDADYDMRAESGVLWVAQTFRNDSRAASAFMQCVESLVQSRGRLSFLLSEGEITLDLLVPRVSEEFPLYMESDVLQRAIVLNRRMVDFISQTFDQDNDTIRERFAKSIVYVTRIYSAILSGSAESTRGPGGSNPDFHQEDNLSTARKALEEMESLHGEYMKSFVNLVKAISQHVGSGATHQDSRFVDEGTRDAETDPSSPRTVEVDDLLGFKERVRWAAVTRLLVADPALHEEGPGMEASGPATVNMTEMSRVDLKHKDEDDTEIVRDLSPPS
ncbi:hypothetical protein EST38_g3881 [Candolleomyces aberdarensis]|uniref:DUF6535 domain-containing protein n=1 Tax=Candolleomyces aberdarensis TaxID=2316362 RepID=A0A4Q2DR12_9AGAR|nr:hypothetical protein EST38_g3881 [Candolleomyces aberdarensis]